MSTLTALSWDSEFFGFNICKIKGSINSQAEEKSLHLLFEELHYKLGYYASPVPLAWPTDKSKHFDIILVDEKTSFLKDIEKILQSEACIRPYPKEPPNEKLIALALMSGTLSRFNVDKKFGSADFKALYVKWITDSVLKRIALETLVYDVDQEIAGFVTLAEENHTGKIGLIAVDPKHRGRGIGKKLMQAAENWFSDHGFNQLEVVTQGENTAACRLYESRGFRRQPVEYFYHFWIREES